MSRARNRSRKVRRDTRPTILEQAVADVRRAFRMAPPEKALLLAARALISRSQRAACSPPTVNDAREKVCALSDTPLFAHRNRPT